MEKNITSSQIVGMIIDKIDQVNMDDVKLDVERFIASTQKLDIWSRQYFKDLVAHIKFTE